MNNLIVEEAFLVDQRTKKLKKELNFGFLALAKLLYENKKKGIYKMLGYDNLESYIAQPELSLERSLVYRLIQIYEIFILKHGVAPERLNKIDLSKLKAIVPKITESNLDEYLSKAETLSKSDLQIVVSGKEPDIHEHEFLLMCKTCHKLND